MIAARTCAACGAVETKVRRLITVGEMLDLPVPLDMADAAPELWAVPYCRARDCIGAAARRYVRSCLDKVRTGRGIVRGRV